MLKRANAIFVIAVLFCMAPLAAHALTPYSQDFESLVKADTAALANDGWLVFGNVFFLDGSYNYGYGPFAAPNDGAAFCAIVDDQGIGFQAMAVYSDYNNTAHPTSIIESNVFQEQMVGAGDIGDTWTFDFQAKLGNLAGASTALAFIKTLDPNAGYAMTNFITADMTNISTDWGAYSLSIFVDAALDGQILQIGFMNTATNYEPSGVFYDEIEFYSDGTVDGEDESWGGVKTLFR